MKKNQYINHYIIQKNINTKTDIMNVQWHNHPQIVSIYNKITKTKQTQGAYCVKYTNVSNIIYIVTAPNVKTP